MGNRVGLTSTGIENSDTTQSEILRATVRNEPEIVRNWIIQNGVGGVNVPDSV